jgi:hypothetical protein
MEASDQLYIQAVLSPRKDSGTHIIGGWVDPRDALDFLETKKSLDPARIRTSDRPVPSPVITQTTIWILIYAS